MKCLRLTQHTPQFSVIVNVARVQVVSYTSFKQRCILRDDSQSASQIKQADGGGVQVVNASLKDLVSLLFSRALLHGLPDIARSWFDYSEKC